MSLREKKTSSMTEILSTLFNPDIERGGKKQISESGEMVKIDILTSARVFIKLPRMGKFTGSGIYAVRLSKL